MQVFFEEILPKIFHPVLPDDNGWEVWRSRAVGTEGAGGPHRGGGGPQILADHLNPISNRELQIMPTTLLLDPSKKIFRPSYGPAQWYARPCSVSDLSAVWRSRCAACATISLSLSHNSRSRWKKSLALVSALQIRKCITYVTQCGQISREIAWYCFQIFSENFFEQFFVSWFSFVLIT